LVNVKTTDTISTITTNIKDTIDALPNYTATTSSSGVITATSTQLGNETLAVFKPYGTGVTSTVFLTQNGTTALSEIFTLTVTQKPVSQGIIQIVLDNESVYVDKKKLTSSKDILADYILVLDGFSSKMKNYVYAAYGQPYRRNVTIPIFCLSKNSEDAASLSSKVEYFITQNVSLFTAQGLRCPQVRNNGIVSTDELGWLASSDVISAYMIVLEGFVIF